ncbi:MAG: ATP12 family protein [Pseudomonadota bacterium]
MSETLRRFYKIASVVETINGWHVTLDERPVRTPGRALQCVPTHALALAIADEWNRQGDTVDVARMHMTRLANVAIDRTPETRDELAREVVRFCETDLTCHLEANASALRARQERVWKPLRDWVGASLGVVLVPVEGIIPNGQPEASLDAAQRHAASLGDFQLTGLVYGCGLLGSAILALAVEQGHIEGHAAFEASIVDTVFQSERWGEDNEAQAVLDQRRVEAVALGAWFVALDLSS